jgi:hypothetical protein
MKHLSRNLVIATPFILLLAHYLAVLPHEYAHSFMAWLLGYKDNPLLITFGGTSLLNLVTLLHIDENVDYNNIIAHGHLFYVALIAFAGPGIANGLLYSISLYFLSQERHHNKPYLFYFMFWFNLLNFANFYDYVPIRTFSPEGDMANLARGLNISPWWIYIIVGYVVAFVFWHFFTVTMVEAYKHLKLNSTLSRASLLILCVLVIFGYYGMAGYIGNGDISHFLSATSVIMIPGIIIACWPTREWMRRQCLEIL